MIKFFRKIRKDLLSEGKTGKYFKYAIGEIVLVVIGILLALQINNWNSQRLNNSRNQQLLAKLSKELDLNIERATHLDTIDDGNFSDRFTHTDSLMNLLNNNKISDNLDYMVSRQIFYVNTFNLNTSVFEELKNTSSLYSIGSDSLVTEIQKYYQLCKRDSFYNLEYGEDTNARKEKCLNGWFDFKYLYRRNPEEAVKYHQWINNPRSPQYINLRQYVSSARVHSYVMSRKLKRIIEESERIKYLIAIETKPSEQD